MIFETHIHLSDPRFVDLEQLLQEARNHGVSRFLAVSYSLDSARKTLERCGHIEDVFFAFGVHPSEIQGELDYAELKRLLSHPRVIALGEIGLDYHYPGDYEAQKVAFIKQIQLADELNLPVLIHSRDACLDTYQILKEHTPKRKGIMHCYSYSGEAAKQFLDLGFYISFAGPVTFTNARQVKEAVALIPLDRILCETDAPYLAPHPYRGQLNQPWMVRLVAEEIARIKGLSLEEMASIMTSNALRLFHEEK